MRRFLLFLWLTLALMPSAMAQGPVPAETRDEAIDRLIVVLEDPTLREALLSRLRSMTAEPPAAAPAPATPLEGAPDAAAGSSPPGLIEAVTEWSTEVLAELPTSTFGVPFDQKASHAWSQARTHFANGLESGALVTFASWALPALIVAVIAALVVRRLTRSLVAPRIPLHRRQLLTGLGLKIVGHAAIFIAAAIAAPWLAPSTAGRHVFLILSAVALFVMMTVDLAVSALSGLARARGVRFVRYCQTRFYPWALAIFLLAGLAGLLMDAGLRLVVGWSMADVAAFGLNISAALVTLGFILRHKRAIGKLIFGSPQADQTQNPFLKATGQLAHRWHLFAYTFLGLSVVSLVAGQRNNDVFSQVLWSFGSVLLALVAVFILRRLLSPGPVHAHRSRGAVAQALISSLFRVMRLAAEAAIGIAALVAISGIWGFDLWAWLMSDGQALARPLFAVAVFALIAWMIWVALDAWIASTLTPTDAFGRPRQRSNRAQTLLPLVRNGAMILLVILTAIAVLANIGIDVTPLIAGAGVFGLALSFGSQQLVQDVITGVFILAEDTIAIGDTINTGDRSGVVESISLRTVRLRDADGALHSIPFSTIKALKNSSRNYGVFRPRYAVPATVDPEEVLETMREATSALRANPRFSGAIIGDLQDLGIDEINAGSITVSGSLRTQPIRQAELARAFNGKLREGLAARGIIL